MSVKWGKQEKQPDQRAQRTTRVLLALSRILENILLVTHLYTDNHARNRTYSDKKILATQCRATCQDTVRAHKQDQRVPVSCHAHSLFAQRLKRKAHS